MIDVLFELISKYSDKMTNIHLYLLDSSIDRNVC